LTEPIKILLTAAVTVVGGVTVFTIGQVFAKFFIEPLHEQRKLIGTIADSLIYYAHHFSDSQERPFAEVRDASDCFRRHASTLMARTVAIPWYRLWALLRLVRPFADIIAARRALIGLSNSLNSADWQRKHKLALQAASALDVTAIDADMLKLAEQFEA
jgi:hypothetical protein